MPSSDSSSLQSFSVFSSHILAPVSITSGAAASSEKMSGTTGFSSSKSIPLSLTTEANSASQPASQSGPSISPVPSSPARPSSTHAPSTTTSVTIVVASTPEWTSTITTQPDITLSTPVGLTTTDSNGGFILTTPPLVTIMSTSLETNGSLTIVTHVVANPPSNGEQLATKSSILQNRGAIAGIFISVGIVIASLIAGLIYCFKRHQRIARRNRWLAGMQRQRPSMSPFEDPFQDTKIDTGTAPAMRSLDSGLQWDRMDAGFLLENSVNHESRGIGHAGSQHSHHPELQPMHTHADSGFSDADEDGNVGLSYLTDAPTNSIPRYGHTTTPSTSSMYPSISPNEDEDEFPSVTKKFEEVIIAPPRPPRSHLRESARKLDYAPLTPPGSASSHSNTPSFITEPRPQEILSRRTILDPRTRSTSP